MNKKVSHMRYNFEVENFEHSNTKVNLKQDRYIPVSRLM